MTLPFLSQLQPISVVAVGASHSLNPRRELKRNVDSARPCSMQRNAVSAKLPFFLLQV